MSTVSATARSLPAALDSDRCQQCRDDSGNALDGEIDLSGSSRTAEAEADGRAGALARGADRLQHVRDGLTPRRTRRPSRDREIAERHQQSLAFHTVNADVQVVRQAPLERAVHAHGGDALTQPVEEATAKPPQTCRFFRQVDAAQLGGCSQPDDAWHIERPGSETVLLPSAELLRRGRQARVFIFKGDGTTSLWAAKILGGRRQKVALYCAPTWRDLSRPLR